MAVAMKFVAIENMTVPTWKKSTVRMRGSEGGAAGPPVLKYVATRTPIVPKTSTMCTNKVSFVKQKIEDAFYLQKVNTTKVMVICSDLR